MFAQWLRHFRVALLFPPPSDASMQSIDGMGDARLASVQRHSRPNRSALCYVDKQGKVVVKSAFGCRELNSGPPVEVPMRMASRSIRSAS